MAPVGKVLKILDLEMFFVGLPPVDEILVTARALYMGARTSKLSSHSV